MTVALDANLGATDGSFAGSLTVTLTTTAAAAAATRIVVLISYFHPNSNVTGVTIGGSAATLDKHAGAGSDKFDIWSLHSAGGLASSSAIVATVANTTLGGGVLIGAVSFTGVASSSALDTTSSAAGSGSSWSSGSATNAIADSVFVGGAGDEDTTAGTSSTAVSGTELHDRYRASDQQGFATGYKVVSTIASDSISGTFSNSASTANTGALAIYKGTGTASAAFVDPLDPQIQWTDDFGPGEDFGPNPFLDDAQPVTTAAQVYTLTLTATAGSTATIIRQANAIRAATSTAVPSITRQVNAIRAAASPGVAVVVKRAQRILAVSSAGVASIATTKVTLLTLSVSSAAVATLTTVGSYFRTLAATSVAAVVLRRAVNKTVSVSSASSASVNTVTIPAGGGGTPNQMPTKGAG
jgi:hypothetical protein